MMFDKKKFQNTVDKLKQLFIKKQELLVLGFYAFSIVFLFNKILINPDEYLYAATGNGMVSAFKGEGCLSCIDTYHTFLLPSIIAIFNSATGINSFFIYRFIIVLFSLSFVYVLYKIYKEIFHENENLRKISFLLLLLFPGYFYLSGLILVDNLALFFFTCLVYSIVKKTSYWKIGALLTLLFLSKDYYIFFGAFIVTVVIMFDAFEEKKKTLFEKVIFVLKNLLVSFSFPISALIIILFFPIFPYPSLLETTMFSVFHGFYSVPGAYIKEFMYGTSVILNEQSVQTVQNVSSAHAAVFIDADLVLYDVKFGVLEYFSNIFKEVHVNPWVFPLVTFGIFIRCKDYFLRKQDNSKRRNDLLMMSIIFVMAYFFFQTSGTGGHGFRIILPIMIPFIYFMLYAIDDVLKKEKPYPRHIVFYFFSLLYISTFLYILTFLYAVDNYSSSMMSKIQIVQIYSEYKIYINLFFYAMPLFIILSKTSHKLKIIILCLWLFMAFLYKTIPSVLESYLLKNVSNIDYNLDFSKKYLYEIEKRDPIVLTNYERAYNFYSSSIKIPNNLRMNFPIIRPKPTMIYEQRVFEISEERFGEVTPMNLCNGGVNYIFYVNKYFEDNGINEKIRKIEGIEVIADFYGRSKKISWIIYQFDRSTCK